MRKKNLHTFLIHEEEREGEEEVDCELAGGLKRILVVREENAELGFDPFRARDTLNCTVWVKVACARVASMRITLHETLA